MPHVVVMGNGTVGGKPALGEVAIPLGHLGGGVAGEVETRTPAPRCQRPSVASADLSQRVRARRDVTDPLTLPATASTDSATPVRRRQGTPAAATTA